jgi:O-antigen ligase
MFLAHPLFGAGIGAYMQQQIQSTGVPLVLHSTPVWLLAETGVIGFGVFAAAAWRLGAAAIRHRNEPAARLAIMILCALAAMSAAHEMLYQRGFWLLLGAVLAMPATATADGRRD